MYGNNKIKTKKYKENNALLNYLDIFKISLNLLLKFKFFNTPSTSRELYNLS